MNGQLSKWTDGCLVIASSCSHCLLVGFSGILLVVNSLKTEGNKTKNKEKLTIVETATPSFVVRHLPQRSSNYKILDDSQTYLSTPF